MATHDPVHDRQLMYAAFDQVLFEALHIIGPTPAVVEDLGGTCTPAMSLTVEGLPRIGGIATLASAASRGVWGLGMTKKAVANQRPI